MRYTTYFAGFALAVGMVLSGASTLSAADWRDSNRDHQDIRRDYNQLGSLRAEIAHDRARLDEDVRCRRWDAARRDRAELARDERALDFAMRDVRGDRSYERNEYRDLRSDSGNRNYSDRDYSDRNYSSRDGYNSGFTGRR